MPAATGLKRLGIAAGVVVVAGVAGLLAAPWLIPVGGARGAVTAQIRAVTGLEPVVHGPVEVSLFPSGTVRLGDVVLGDASGHTPPLAADRLVAHLRFLPLLLGRIEIADIVLDHPHLTVKIDKDGRSNWSPLLVALATALKPVERIVSFTEIRIDNGTIAIEDASHALTENLSKVDLSLAWPSISKSFGATGHFTWRGEPVDASIVISDFLAALAGDNSGLKIRLSGAPLRLAFEGTIGSEPTFKADGTLSVEAASLRDALRWTGDTPVPAGGFGRFTLKGHAVMVESSMALGPVNVELDGNAANGALSYAADGQHTWQGTLAADDLDLSPYVSTIRLMAANAREWDGKPLNLDGLNSFGLDLRLSAAKVRIGRVQLGRTAAGASLRDGKLLLSVIESQAFNGMIHGSLALARSHTGAELKSEMHFVDVDLESCLGELFGLHRLEGKGNLDFALEGSGGSVLELTRNLSPGTIAARLPAGRARRDQRRAGAAAARAAPAVGRRLSQRPHAVRQAQARAQGDQRRRHDRRGEHQRIDCADCDRRHRLGAVARRRSQGHREPARQCQQHRVRAAVRGLRPVGRRHADARPDRPAAPLGTPAAPLLLDAVRDQKVARRGALGARPPDGAAQGARSGASRPPPMRCRPEK